MATKGKGKIINSWTEAVPTQAGEPELGKIPISLTVGDGLFHIPLPSYVCEFFGRHIDDPDRDKGYDGDLHEVTARTIDGAKGTYKYVVNMYCERIKDQNRRKMIVVTFQANSSKYHKFLNPGKISEMSFAQSPALSLTYEILWEVNGALYDVYQSGDRVNMSWKKKMPDATESRGSRSTFVLDWTEAREAFFASITANMERLIQLITDMLLGDTSAQVDKMIAGGGLAALPAPEQEKDQ